MGKKIDSLIKLAGMGFNTPEFEIIRSTEDLERFRPFWDTISIRTDLSTPSPAHIKLPFFPDQSPTMAKEIIGNLLTQGFEVIAARGIDPGRSLAGGKYLKDQGDEFIEYFMGPGTIRDMESGKVQFQTLDLSYSRVFPLNQCPVELIAYREPLQRMRAQAELLRGGFVLEWSIYSEKIGRRAERIIYWELVQLRG